MKILIVLSLVLSLGCTNSETPMEKVPLTSKEAEGKLVPKEIDCKGWGSCRNLSSKLFLPCVHLQPDISSFTPSQTQYSTNSTKPCNHRMPGAPHPAWLPHHQYNPTKGQQLDAEMVKPIFAPDHKKYSN